MRIPFTTFVSEFKYFNVLLDKHDRKINHEIQNKQVGSSNIVLAYGKKYKVHRTDQAQQKEQELK